MTDAVGIAALLEELDRRSPAGFALALHIRFTTPTYLFQTYPQRWRDHYSASGLVVHDPTVRWGLQNLGHARWSDLEAIDSRRVLEHAKDFGIMNGAVIAVLGAGSRSIGSLARADRDYSETEMDEMEDLLGELHRATIGLGELSERDQRALTELSVRLTH